MEEVAGNILKHLTGNKSSSQTFLVAYNLETMIVKTDYKSKTEELRKK